MSHEPTYTADELALACPHLSTPDPVEADAVDVQAILDAYYRS